MSGDWRGERYAANPWLSSRAGLGQDAAGSLGNGSVLASWLYIFVWLASLLDPLAGLPVAGDAAGLALVAFLLLQFRSQRRYGQVFFLAMAGLGALGLAGLAARGGHPMALFLGAWRRGAAYAAFFLSLTTLRDAAETSALVRRCGQHLVAQPPGRRYAALTAGGHVFGIILSYGAIELLGAMVMRANTLATAGSEAVRQVRSRRMLMAIYRGFAVMNCWSPLNIMTAVVSTAVPGAPMGRLLPIAFVVSVGMCALGWLDDRLGAPRGATASGRPASSESWSIHLGIIALVALVMGLAEGSAVLLGIPLVTGVTLVVPLVALGWLVVQSWPLARARGRAFALAWIGRRVGRFRLRIPGFRGEANVLGWSGFVGVALGGALPAGGLAPVIGHLPVWMIPLLVPLLLMATGQIGLNPVAAVALLGAAIPDPAAIGLSPSVLGFACMLGWGVGVSVTAMSASAITTARWLGVSPFTVSALWNARFTFASLILSWAAILAVAAWL